MSLLKRYRGPLVPKWVPFIVEAQRLIVDAYLAAPPPKALAIAPSGKLGSTTQALDVDDAKKEALAKCNSQVTPGSVKCFIYSVNNDVDAYVSTARQ